LTAIEAPLRTHTLRRQVPAFAAVGAFGFVVDSSLTYFFVRALHLDPLVARLPAFAIATVVNFALNRALTFAASRAPLLGAFVRYCMVCGVGLAVNWSAYALALAAAGWLGLPTPPATLPVFIAFGTGVAMFATFFGFKLFAFRA
jgi:putative flippase GtrA